jgi:hypothetical protein
VTTVTTHHRPARIVRAPRVVGREGQTFLNSGQNRQDSRSCPDFFKIICQKYTRLYIKPLIRHEKIYTRGQKRGRKKNYMTCVCKARYMSCMTDLYRDIYIKIFNLTRRLSGLHSYVKQDGYISCKKTTIECNDTIYIRMVPQVSYMTRVCLVCHIHIQ